MKLYRDAEGKWVGTQAEAKNKNVIEVPVDKPGLLEWLNANIVDRDRSTDDGSGSRPADKQIACPKCKFTPDAAANYAAVLKRSVTMDVLERRILEGDVNDTIRLTSAVIERQQDFLKCHS